MLAALLARALLMTFAWPEGGLMELEPSWVARNLVEGRGFVCPRYGLHLRAWKEPLYIALLALLRATLGPDQLPIAVMQSCFGAASAGLAVLLATEIRLASLPALLAGLIVALHPFLAYYDTRAVHPLTLNTTLYLAMLLGIVRAVRSGSNREAVRAGLLAGLGLWQRGTLLLAGVGAWLAVGSSWQRLRSLALWLAIAGAVIAPWLARNAVVVGSPVLTTDATHVFWLGNNPNANGRYVDDRGRSHFEAAPRSLKLRLVSSTELEQHHLFLSEGLRFVRENPGRFLELVAVRIGGFFWFPPLAGQRYSPGATRVYQGYYVLLALVGLAGAVHFWRGSDPAGRLALRAAAGSVLGLAAIHAVTAIDVNHRMPLDMLLAIFAGHAIGTWWSRRQARAAQ